VTVPPPPIRLNEAAGIAGEAVGRLRAVSAARRRRFLSDLGGDRGPLRAIAEAVKAKGYAISHEGVAGVLRARGG
jgi:hypothetical protein